MVRSVAFRSSMGGVAVGALSAGGMRWLGSSVVLIAAVGFVWTVATASMLYVSQSNPGHTDAGPWGGVVGGSLLFGVALNLSDIGLTSEAVAALTVLAIGFTLLGYAGGMAAAYRQKRGAQPADETATDG